MTCMLLCEAPHWTIKNLGLVLGIPLAHHEMLQMQSQSFFLFVCFLAKTSELLKFQRGSSFLHKRETQFLRLHAYGMLHIHGALQGKAEAFLVALCKIWVRKRYWRKFDFFHNISSTVLMFFIRIRLRKTSGDISLESTHFYDSSKSKAECFGTFFLPEKKGWTGHP